MADALSRKEVEAYVAALSSVKSTFLDRVREQSLLDRAYLKLKEEITQCLVQRYWVEDGLI